MIFALGIDPAQHSGVALVGFGAGAICLGVWPVYGDSWRAWSTRAIDAARAIKTIVGDNEVFGWYEKTPPNRGGKSWDPRPMSERAGAMILALHVADVHVALEGVQCSQWTSLAGVPAGKNGGGEHRIQEASLRIGAAGIWLAELEHCKIDCAEALLIAYGCLCKARQPKNKQFLLFPSASTATAGRRKREISVAEKKMKKKTEVPHG